MKRAARIIRRGSSTNEISGSSGVRSRLWISRSSTPPYGSTRVGSGRAMAIELTVKSRRERSVSSESEKVTEGLRLSGR